MSFNLVVLPPTHHTQNPHVYFPDDWIKRIKKAIPGIDINLCNSQDQAIKIIENADAAYGEVSPQIFDKATKLRWICCPWAGPPAGYYHKALVESNVLVTNMREIYSDHIATHIISLVLSFAKNINRYMEHQHLRQWEPIYQPVHLPESTALIVGLGGIGTETARLCSALGITVIGIDPRRTTCPEGVEKIFNPSYLDEMLPQADFVIVTVPETPDTQNLFHEAKFKLMKKGSFFINVGRGSTVVLDDLTTAVKTKHLGGAALDVFEKEPLPVAHPLWDTKGIIITPHIAGLGPHTMERRAKILIENCVRFNKNQELLNIVDKANWF